VLPGRWLQPGVGPWRRTTTLAMRRLSISTILNSKRPADNCSPRRYVAEHVEEVAAECHVLAVGDRRLEPLAHLVTLARPSTASGWRPHGRSRAPRRRRTRRRGRRRAVRGGP